MIKRIKLPFSYRILSVLGGVIGQVCWNWLEIHSLIVDENLREYGYGIKLLLEIEKIAIDTDCEFYQKIH